MTEDKNLLQQIREGWQDTFYIWRKEMRSVFTDEGVLLFLVIVPLLYPVIYSWIYTNEVVRDVPVAVVDMDHSQLSREIIRKIDASADTKIAAYCNSIEDGRDLVGRQRAKGVIYIPADFSRKVYRHQQAHLSLYCDMTIMLNYKAIYQTTNAVCSQINSRIQIQQSGSFTTRDEEITAEPFKMRDVPIFNSTIGYGNAILPPVYVLILYQTLLLAIGLSAGTARENNRYKELVPVSQHYNGILRIVLGKSFCYFLFCCINATVLTVVMPHLFRFTTMVHAADLLPFMFAFVLASIFFGMAASCLVRYRENVILLVIFTSVPLLFMTGTSWPQSNIPKFWQWVACIFPATFGQRGYVRLSSMGGDLHDVQFEYQGLWIQTAIYFILTCLVYRYQIEKSKRQSKKKLKQIGEAIDNSESVEQPSA
ncbi:MAG: ABC transporter permease [Prevotella sp.]|jgi:ABC-2 type transport system permease protein